MARSIISPYVPPSARSSDYGPREVYEDVSLRLAVLGTRSAPCLLLTRTIHAVFDLTTLIPGAAGTQVLRTSQSPTISSSIHPTCIYNVPEVVVVVVILGGYNAPRIFQPAYRLPGSRYGDSQGVSQTLQCSIRKLDVPWPTRDDGLWTQPLRPQR